MEQVHGKVRRATQVEISPFTTGGKQLLSRAQISEPQKLNEKRIAKSTFWRMLGPNLQKIIGN